MFWLRRAGTVFECAPKRFDKSRAAASEGASDLQGLPPGQSDSAHTGNVMSGPVKIEPLPVRTPLCRNCVHTIGGPVRRRPFISPLLPAAAPNIIEVADSARRSLNEVTSLVEGSVPKENPAFSYIGGYEGC